MKIQKMKGTGRKFICGKCNSKSLTITNSFDLGPDNRSDDRFLQTIKCTRCGFKGIAVYEESRRGSFDSESWSHTGYVVPSEVLNETISVINNEIKETNLHDLTKKASSSFNMRFS